MKLWLLFDCISYEGDWLIAVCTSQEMAEKALALYADRQSGTLEIRECETDVFSVERWRNGKVFPDFLRENRADNPYMPIVEYQAVKAS
jgi:hypothetical protein